MSAEGGVSEESPARRTRWLSTGLESLLATLTERHQAHPDQPDFDVLIVGSGYGASVAADRLAGCTDANGRSLRIGLLERGREYLPGAFPDRAADLAGHVRFTTPEGTQAKGRLEGLFDVRIGKDVSVLVGNGLGGGSLINAGVMAFPLDEVLADAAWPADLRGAGPALRARAERLAQELGVAGPGADDEVRPQLLRAQAMQALGAASVPISVALAGGTYSVGQVALERCIACGDCATGCNHGAKVSLDVGLLRRAAARGVAMYSGATVTRVLPHEQGWCVEVWHTDKHLRERMAGPALLTAGRVVLAAGTLGSTEILMRSRAAGLAVSGCLGSRFSANGDLLATVVADRQVFQGVADETRPPDQRGVGPTITAMLDRRNRPGVQASYVVQDLGVPAALQRLFEEVMATAYLLQRVDQADKTGHKAFDDRQAACLADPMAVDPAQVRRSQVLALITRDAARGVITAVPDALDCPADAGVRIDWKDLRNDPAFDAVHEDFAAHLREAFGADAVLLTNPMWRMLSPGVERLLGTQRGPLLTVHPLGGCAMGDNRAHAVVDRDGRVFDPREADGRAVHEGLVVLDGAIVPTSLGINPALTIATLADLAVERLIDQHWNLRRPSSRPPPPPAVRPIFAVRRGRELPLRTEVQVVEKLAGPIEVQGVRLWLELALVYEPRALFPGPASGDDGSRPVFTQEGHRLPVAVHPQLSRLRVFPASAGVLPESTLDEVTALISVPLTEGGYLRFFHREASTPGERRCRAWRAWFRNRGLRDAVLSWLDKSKAPFLKTLCQSLSLASRAGEVRLFDYHLPLGEPTVEISDDLTPDLASAVRALVDALQQPGSVLQGQKRLTYERRANLWDQLMRMRVSQLGGLRPATPAELMVQVSYFARKGMPLLRVVQQENQPAALIDVLAFLLYTARIFLNIHLWSGRKPDVDQSGREAQRLPNTLPGLPSPNKHRIRLPGPGEEIQLTAYPLKNNSGLPPVLMIHGYSASGTTFAHPALRPSLAEYCWKHGREPWVLDLRTSSGMPTRSRAYAFEDIARHDIPAAVAEVCKRTGCVQIDVVTHCMGSVMFSMAISSSMPAAPSILQSTRRWVLSQIPPVMRFSPNNLIRAYLIAWFRQHVQDFPYELKPGGAGRGADADLYDRLLGTLPYLNDALGSEFDLENPGLPWRRVPWVGTRHRLDALVGRAFDARNMDAAVLEHIDDFFGPLNLGTMAQPIHFARYGSPADQHGESWLDRLPVGQLSRIPMLSLHGMTNGLADSAASIQIFSAWCDRHRLDVTIKSFDGVGHQDLLIGRVRTAAFTCIEDFLNRP